MNRFKLIIIFMLVASSTEICTSQNNVESSENSDFYAQPKLTKEALHRFNARADRTEAVLHESHEISTRIEQEIRAQSNHIENIEDRFEKFCNDFSQLRQQEEQQNTAISHEVKETKMLLNNIKQSFYP